MIDDDSWHIHELRTPNDEYNNNKNQQQQQAIPETKLVAKTENFHAHCRNRIHNNNRIEH